MDHYFNNTNMLLTPNIVPQGLNEQHSTAQPHIIIWDDTASGKDKPTVMGTAHC